MELSRRTATGTLSEAFGRDALDLDITSRTLGFKRVGKKDIPLLSPKARQLMEAHIAGINAYLKQYKDQLPIEFTLTQVTPKKWTLEDSMAYSRLMAWQMSHGWHSTWVRQQIVEKIGAERASELDIHYSKDNPSIVPQGIEVNNLDESTVFNATQHPFLQQNGGSNSWAISPQKSTTNHALLCNDPHLGLTAPAIWYENHLHCPEYHATGISVAGFPLVVIGHNENIGWGITLAFTDCEDLFIEKFKNDGTYKYKVGKEWKKAKVKKEKIAIKEGTYANDYLGSSIALDATGAKIVLGGKNDNGYSSGQVKVYEKNGGTWNFIQKLTGDSYYNHRPVNYAIFGFKVDLSADGTTFIGASANSNEGLVQLEAFRYLSSQIPTNFSAENITTTSADVTWNYVVGPSSYILKYRKVGDTNWIILNETENTTIQIENLNYDTDYEAQIQHLYSDSNTSSFSSSLLFSTATPSINDLTYVPDDNFEQALIDEGLDNVLDNYVLTTNINSLTFLDVSYRNISDLTGIEDFEGLDTFVCDNNQISTLDLSNNHILEFSCSNNLLTSLILNADARVVYCLNNLLTSLNVPSGVSNLECSNNNITSLDLSKTTELSVLNVSNNNLSFLDFRNGENAQISSSYDYRTGYDYSFDARNNPELSCIFVDDASFCTTNWKKVDATSNFVANETACNSLSVSEFTNSSFRIFSNPVNENILISIDEKVSFLLSNINGKVLKKGKLNIGNNAINVSKFAKGIYFLRVNNQKKSTSKKIIIH